MKAALVRIEESDEGAISKFEMDDGAFACFTLGPDDQDTKKFYLPNGTYICRRFHGTKWPITFEITRPETDGVDGHKYLLFHAGNVEEDTLGCQVMGSTVGKLKGERAVLNSGATFKNFLEYTKDVDEFDMEVTEDYPS